MFNPEIAKYNLAHRARFQHLMINQFVRFRLIDGSYSEGYIHKIEPDMIELTDRGSSDSVVHTGFRSHIWLEIIEDHAELIRGQNHALKAVLSLCEGKQPISALTQEVDQLFQKIKEHIQRLQKNP